MGDAVSQHEAPNNDERKDKIWLLRAAARRDELAGRIESRGRSTYDMPEGRKSGALLYSSLPRVYKHACCGPYAMAKPGAA
ncbi:uncharacterized protein LAESUDRAFT_722104 [Laetiporus sulphureus 93-53]|uniref:Uncharacterized protein n=1 Tax=Laetiporus sulphureus 93-53 TaxID=1314785 RepID=A0A165G7W6_9APHY|nr:uncharacterized protein LAESUDRAFT_722104 [Laetiporus sulphureus 93-53]KZT09950.1 hypothetical protein LAESUDRAFT_722104 [Laetiporus sulphureus 93-53]